jgi:NAD(P)-dependent dehydrogenase (short-subunit alcohol dehydrogenase family)
MGRDPDRLMTMAQKLGTAYQAADVTDRDQLATAFAAAGKQHGTITILVNNAGAAEAAPFGKMDDELWDRLIAVNLTGVYNCTRAAINAMAEARVGRVVNIASTAGLKGYAYVAAYCAAKHGVVGLTRALALEYAKKGVTVNAVCPGYTNTEIIEASLDKIVAATGRSRDEALAELVQVNPQRRLIEPEEVAATVMWLCQQESITGQAIAVAGGEVM